MPINFLHSNKINNMKIEANTIQEYISQLPEDRKEAIENLHIIFSTNSINQYYKNFLQCRKD
jgi:hypothetical protein